MNSVFYQDRNAVRISIMPLYFVDITALFNLLMKVKFKFQYKKLTVGCRLFSGQFFLQKRTVDYPLLVRTLFKIIQPQHIVSDFFYLLVQ
jgi:hypothetical protein